LGDGVHRILQEEFEFTAMLARRFNRGKRIGFRAAIHLIAFLICAPALAQRPGCPPSRTPIKLNFETRAPAPDFNHRLNLSGIANEARSQDARGEVPSRPVGLTTVDTMFGLKGGSSIITRGRSACSYLTSVEITFGWDRMQVFVPNEYPQGSCEYRAVIDHENQHVSIIRSTLREFAPIARARVESVLAQSKPISGGRDGDVDRALAPLKAQLTAMLTEFNALHSARSAHIDTPSNYKAVTAMCKNWDGPAK
jgi:hypothetical protein